MADETPKPITISEKFGRAVWRVHHPEDAPPPLTDEQIGRMWAGAAEKSPDHTVVDGKPIYMWLPDRVPDPLFSVIGYPYSSEAEVFAAVGVALRGILAFVAGLPAELR